MLFTIRDEARACKKGFKAKDPRGRLKKVLTYVDDSPDEAFESGLLIAPQKIFSLRPRTTVCKALNAPADSPRLLNQLHKVLLILIPISRNWKMRRPSTLRQPSN
jgi:hypothetical protein